MLRSVKPDQIYADRNEQADAGDESPAKDNSHAQTYIFGRAFTIKDESCWRISFSSDMPSL